MRIATAGVRTGFAMTGLLHGCGARPGGGTHGCRPTGWFVGQGPRALPGGCGADPAARQTQRLPVSIGQHKRGARRGVRRRDDAKARYEICISRFAWRKWIDVNVTSAAERIPKPWVLAAFFGHFLPLLAESAPPEAFAGARGTAQGDGLPQPVCAPASQ